MAPCNKGAMSKSTSRVSKGEKTKAQQIVKMQMPSLFRHQGATIVGGREVPQSGTRLNESPS
eukprot:4987431-Amphidinium_carterae.1